MELGARHQAPCPKPHASPLPSLIRDQPPDHSFYYLISTSIVNWMKTGMRQSFGAPVNENVRGEAGACGGMGHGAWGMVLLVWVLLVVGMTEAFGQEVGDYRSNAAVMDWSNVASWEIGNGTNWVPATTYPGQVEGTGRVTIRTGHTVTINATPANAVFSLYVENLGVLQYEAANARTLTVSDIITINSGGTFSSGLSGTVTIHELIIDGSIVNNGILNFSDNGNASGVGITFRGAGNEAFDIENATLTNLRAENGLVVNKGTSATSILWFTPGGPFQVLSGTSLTQGFLTITSGTFGINGVGAYSHPLFYATTGSYTIPPAGGFRLDNPNATISGIYGTLTNNGEVVIMDGVYNVGSGSGNELLTTQTGRFEMSGGTFNSSGRFRIDGGDCIITGGTLNLATIGHRDMTRAAFYASPSADLSISGDPLITFTHPNSHSDPFNDIQIEAGEIKNITGGTFQMGTSATPVTPISTFLVNSDIPVHNLMVYNRFSRVSLTDDLAINNQLTLNGRLLMNNYNLNLGAPAIVGDFHANRGMIVPGTGEVRKAIIPDVSFLFPFGNSSGTTAYLPVTLDFTGGTFTPGATASVGMINSKHPQNVNTTNFLRRYWTVRTTGITNPVYNFTGTYANPVNDVVGDYNWMTTGVYTTAWRRLSASNNIGFTIYASGLTGDAAITGINSAAAPVVTVTATPNPVCSGSPVQLTATATGDGPFNYSWNPVAGLSDPTIYNPVATTPIVNTPTTISYTVIVTDDMGGSATGSATVTVNPLPTATIAGNNAVCQNANAPDITFTGDLGTAPYTFTYTINGGTNQTVTSVGTTATLAVPTGTAGPFEYELVSVRDAGSTNCSNTASGSATITVNSLPTATITGTRDVCQNETAPNITFTGGEGTAPYTFIYRIDGGPDQSVTSDGNIATVAVPTDGERTFVYTLVSVQDASSTLCSQDQNGSATITVHPLPVATAGSDSPVCAGQTLNLTASGGVSYRWTGPNGWDSTLQNPSIGNVQTTAAGTYTVTVTDNHGCIATASTTVIVNPAPSVSITASPGNTVCSGTNVTFTTSPSNAGDNPTYQWRINGVDVPDANNPTFSSTTLANSQLVTVVITADPTYCSATALSNVITMTVNAPVMPTVSILESVNDICAGATVNFTSIVVNGGTAPIYQWQINGANITGATSATFSSGTLNDGDQVRVAITSNATCASPLTANSNAVIMLVNPLLTPSVSISANPSTPICPGTLVSFTATPTNGGSNPTYQWSVNGTPVGSNSFTFTSSTLADGDDVRVRMSSNANCGSPTFANSDEIEMEVNPGTPGIPGIIAGNILVCPAVSETYTIVPVTNATSYNWTVPAGWNITGPINTASITVTTGTTGQNGNISVTASNSCGTSAVRTLGVTVGSESIAPTGITIANNNTCFGTSKTLTVNGGSLGTGATWEWFTSSCGGTPAGIGTSITVNPAAGTSTIYYVRATGTCNTTSCGTGTVIVNPAAPIQPSVIAGTTPVCPAQAGLGYSITAVADATTYNWTVPTGWNITAGNGTTSITVTSGNAGQNGNISVTAANSCGTSLVRSLAVTVGPGTPATPEIIAGAIEQCITSSGLVYSVAAVPNATSYVWTVPSGWTITSVPPYTNSITVSTNGIASGGNITVIAGNTCGQSSASVLPVNIETGAPNTPGLISGLEVICPAKSTIYTIDPVPGATSYTWTVPPSWTIISGQGTTSITVDVLITSLSGNVTVTTNNVCGSSPARTHTVTVSSNTSVYAGRDRIVCYGTASISLEGAIQGLNNHTQWDWVSLSGGTIVSDRSLTSRYDFPNGATTTGTLRIRIRTNETVVGCDPIEDEMTITIMPTPTANAGPDQTICTGSSVNLAGSIGGGASTATWSGGTGTYTPNANSLNAVYAPSPTEVAAGSVILTLTTDDPIGTCVAVSDQVRITINSLPVVNAGIDQTICTGSPVQLAGSVNGGGATSGTWSGGTGSFSDPTSLNAVYTPTIAEITAGTVTLTLTSNDPAGPCDPVADQVTITIHPVATVNAGGDQTICANSTVALAATVGTGATSGTWSGGTGTFNPNNTSLNPAYTPSAAEIIAGTVTLTFTTNDPLGPCGAVTDQVIITIDPLPTVNAGSDQTICATSTVPLAGTVGGGVTTGTWSGGAGSFNPDNLTLNTVYTPSAAEISDGSVTLILTTDDPEGPCGAVSDQVQITINPSATVNAGTDQTICEGTDLILGGSVGGAVSSGTWSGGSGTFSPNNTTLNATYSPGFDETGLVILTLTTNVPVGECDAVSDQMSITIYPRPLVDAGTDQTICSSGTATMNGTFSGATSATWSTSGGGTFDDITSPTAVYTPGNSDLFNGTVILTYTTDDPDGPCGQANDFITLTINDAIQITTEPVNTGVCATYPATLTVQAVGDNLTYAWYAGVAPNGTAVVNTANISGAQSASLHFTNSTSVNGGSYYVVINGATGCSSVTSEVVTLNVDQEITITTPFESDEVCVGEDVTFRIVAEPGGLLTYQWRKDGEEIEGETNNSLTLTDVTPEDEGDYDVLIQGLAGYTCSSAQSAVATLTVTPDVTTPVFELGATSTRCQGPGTVTYSATASYSTGITYTLDAASRTGGNTIDEATGTVTYSADWSGAATITARATGCNGPTTTTHIVTITPTVTIAPFLPATSTRCQGAGTVTTTTTATNSTGINYSLDAASLAGGNTIDAATGAVTYVARWSGTTTITASAAGCNGPATTTHVVTITPTVTIAPFSPTTSSRCQGAGTVTTTTTATNSTGITYSLDAVSFAGGNTIDAATGAVTYAAGWVGTTTITASAAGCNGPATTTHVVTVNPTVTINSFSPATSIRCVGAGTVTYSTTATNTTGITYSLDATTASYPGNSINASTGAVTYAAGWSGTTTITASAEGCNGPVTASHTVTVDPPSVGGTISPAISTECTTTNDGTLSLGGNNGTILRWESSVNAGVTWTPIVNTTGTHDFTNLRLTTIFRAVVKNGDCSEVYSALARVMVIPLITPVITTTIRDLCAGGSTTLTATTGGIIQTIEAFTGGSFNNANPTGWRVTENGTVVGLPANADNTATGPWSETNGPRTFNGATYDTYDNTKFAIARGIVNTTMETPVFNLFGLPSAELTFMQAYNLQPGTIAKVELSTDGGNTYNIELASYEGSTGGNINNPVDIDMSNYIGMTNLRIRFNYISTTASGWAVEGVSIPTQQSDVTYTWSPAESLSPPTGSPVTATPGETTTYTLTMTISGCPATATSIVINVANPPIVHTTNACIGGGTVTFTQTEGTLGGIWTVSGGGNINSATGEFTPLVPGCYTATYSTGAAICSDTKSFVVFPSAPIPVFNTACNEPIVMIPPAAIPGFALQYSYDDGATWELTTPPTAESCEGYQIRSRYITTTICDIIPENTSSTIIGCDVSEAETRVVDLTAPVMITCPSATSGSTDLSECYSTSVVLGTPVVIDNCTPAAEIIITNDAPAQYPVGVTTVTWTARDDCGNESTCTQTVTVADNIEVPVFTFCPEDQEQTALPNNCALYDVILTEPIAEDNCTVARLIWTMEGATNLSSPEEGINYVSGQDLNVGLTTITYTAYDAAGNPSLPCSFNVVIKSLNKPEFTVGCPVDVTQNADPDHCYATITVPVPAVTDPCDEGYTLTNDFNDTDNASGNYPIGTTIVIWTITDHLGVTITTCEQRVVVIDLSPTITCPDPIRVQADFELPYQNDVIVPPPTYNDNCPNPVLTWTMVPPDAYASEYEVTELSGTGLYPSPALFYLGVSTINYTVTDSNGNPATCSFTVTVLAEPEITCLGPVTYNTDPGACTATWSSDDYGLPTLVTGLQPITWTWTITDPDGTTVGIPEPFIGSTEIPGPPSIPDYAFKQGTSTILWRAQNVSGFDECTQTITVIDNQPPTFTVPDPLNECVQSLLSAVYDPATIDILPVRPDWYIVAAGSEELDITDLNDNCCDPEDMIINWTIAFGGGYPSVTGTGQPSDYDPDNDGSPNPITLWGSTNFTDIQHTITFTVAECDNSDMTTVHTQTITIRPRPNLIKTTTTMGNP